MQKRNVLSSPRLLELQKKKQKIFLRKVLIFFVFILIVLVALGFASRWQKINISNVETEGNKVITTEDIQKVVKEELSGYYMWVFPKTNFLFYPKKQIEERLAHEFKRLKDIKPRLTEINTLKVSMGERLGSYTWCGDGLPTSEIELEKSKCYFMDDTGYVFDASPYFSNNVYFRFFGGLENQDDSVEGSYYFKDVFKQLVYFTEFLKESKLKPTSMFVKDNGDVEIYLSSNILPPNSPKILIKTDSDFKKIAENLQAALDTEPLKSDFEKKYSTFLYIDLRFGNKVYYKFAQKGGDTADTKTQ